MNNAADFKTANAAWISAGCPVDGALFDARRAARVAMTEAKATSSQAQKDQQKSRAKDGRYAQISACEICSKSAGANYFSCVRADGTKHVCVCEACANRHEGK